MKQGKIKALKDLKGYLFSRKGRQISPIYKAAMLLEVIRRVRINFLFVV
jgi:hypothetical protein